MSKWIVQILLKARTNRGLTKDQMIQMISDVNRQNFIPKMKMNRTAIITKFEQTAFRYLDQMYALGKPPLSR